MSGTLLTPPTIIPPALDPLANSHTADDVEADLQAAFIEVFEDTLRAQLSAINGYGAPHRASFAVVERFTKADGLAMERRANAEAYMAQLFRAWRALNPRRGTQFLRYYLQLLWPGRWTLTQLWQDPAKPYPEHASPTEAPGRMLTSRVLLTLELEGDETGAELSRLVGSFRATIPARLVLDTAIVEEFANPLRLANIAEGLLVEDFEGTATASA